jgi:hypothetical protein
MVPAGESPLPLMVPAGESPLPLNVAGNHCKFPASTPCFAAKSEKPTRKGGMSIPMALSSQNTETPQQ